MIAKPENWSEIRKNTVAIYKNMVYILYKYAEEKI